MRSHTLDAAGPIPASKSAKVSAPRRSPTGVLPRDDHGCPIYPISERRIDAIVHVVSVTAALIGLGLLIEPRLGLDRETLLCLVIYGAGMVATVIASALYNLAPLGRLKAQLRRFDHAAIFLAIAATYTPFAALRLSDPTGALLCGWIWLGALLGMSLKLVAYRRMERIGMALYLALGWSLVLALPQWIAELRPETLWLLLIGGLFYTGGVAVHLRERLANHNAIWHAMVLAGAACHFAAVIREFPA